MSFLWLGLRLARSGTSAGRPRSALVLIGSAVGAVVLASALAAVELVPSQLDECGGAFSCRARAQLSIIAFLSVPVVVLLATLARLSARVRDRQLAALRLLGVSRSQSRLVVAAEAGVVTGVGTVLGLGVFYALRQTLAGVDVAGTVDLPAQLHLGVIGFAVVLVGVPALSAFVALWPARHVSNQPLRARRNGGNKRPATWRLIPLLAGIGVLGYGLVVEYHAERGETEGSPGPFLIGTILVAIALPLAVPILVSLVAKTLVHWGPAPSMRIAGRQLEAEPAATTRVVAAFLTALLLAIAAQSVLAVFEVQPAFAEARQAYTSGPMPWQVWSEGRKPIPGTRLADLPGVLGATPVRVASGKAGTAFIGSCAQLSTVMGGVTDCRDGVPSRIEEFSSDTRVNRTIQLHGEAAGPGRGPTFRIDVPSSVIHVDRTSTAINGDYYSMLIPLDDPSVPTSMRRPSSYRVGTEPNVNLTSLIRHDPSLAGLHAARLVSFDEYLSLRRYEMMLVAGTVTVLLVGLLSLVLAQIDRITERRRQSASLHAIGAPNVVFATSQFIQSAAPLLLGVPLAAALGLLAGRTYLSYGGEAQSTPWSAAGFTAIAALVATIAIAMGVAAISGRPLRSSDLHQE